MSKLLLNILFGNSDNHGRNTSLLKGDGVIKLARVYDFVGIADTLSDLVPKEVLLQELKVTAAERKTEANKIIKGYYLVSLHKVKR